ncbi:MAG: PilZ domain-containing protein [Thermodesulfovibrionia bacterium]
MLDNKRAFVRFDIPLEVKFKTPKNTNEYVVGVTKNFSRKGFCFELQEFDIEPNKIVAFKVRHPQADVFVSVLGDIIWKKRVNTKFMVGVKLREMHSEAKCDILHYCYNTWVNKMQAENRNAKVAYS